MNNHWKRIGEIMNPGAVKIPFDHSATHRGRLCLLNPKDGLLPFTPCGRGGVLLFEPFPPLNNRLNEKLDFSSLITHTLSSSSAAGKDGGNAAVEGAVDGAHSTLMEFSRLIF